MLVKREISQLWSKDLTSRLSGTSHFCLSTVEKILPCLSVINPLGLELRGQSLHQELAHLNVH
jgi:hypothetical protein